MFLGIGHGLGFNSQRKALFALTDLVRSLGGHIFAPGTETYADQAALNPAASALDSQVGYVGSASTQGLGENWILDSTFTSATSSALPAGWYGLGTANGVTAVVSGKGVDAYGTYQEIAFSGTAGGTTASLFLFIGGGSASSQHPAARSGELWSAQLGVRGVSGIQKECGLVIREIASGVYGSLTGSATTLPVNGNFSNIAVTRRLTDTATTKISYYYQITVYASSGVWNQVIRIYAPQLERGHPTAYTPTYGTAISRGVFASAAQATLADTPKLVTLGNARGLEFDGSTDHLVTDITSTSAGYMFAVFQQDEAIGSYNSIFGTASTLGGVLLEVSNTGYPFLSRMASGGSSVAVVAASPITPGVCCLVDAAWTAAGAKCRLNGSYEGSNSTAKDPVSAQILTIGCKNSNTTVGAVTGANFMQGKIGIVGYIPATVPDATQARIRQLAGQIYGVSTL